MSRTRNSRIVLELESQFSCDIHITPIGEIARRLSDMPEETKHAVLTTCEEISTRPSILEHERNRVVLAKLLVSLLPISLPTIDRLLSRSLGRLDYEMHFSLFCFLDYARRTGAAIEGEVLNRAEHYLSQVRASTAMAAWMAGEMLGAHWRRSAACEVLTNVALRGTYVAGRRAALHGLERLLESSRVEDESDRVRDVLRSVSRHDKSEKVKRTAKLALEVQHRSTRSGERLER